MKIMTVAYIDLLGFSANLKEKEKDAVCSIRDLQEIVKARKLDENHYQVDIAAFAQRKLISSFSNFIPFSDSVFITSENSSLFIKQLSNLLLSFFRLYSDEYKNPMKASEPRKVEVSQFTQHGSSIKRENVYEIWFPLIFRGGVSYGQAFETKSYAIQDFSGKDMLNIAGKSVVKAVSLEKSGKGPRIFCDQEFVDSLDKGAKIYINPVNQEVSEILWPMEIFAPENNSTSEISNIRELFVPVVNLWKAFNHSDAGVHYFEFIKLIVTSSLVYFRNVNMEEKVVETLLKLIEENGLIDKVRQLLPKELIPEANK